MVLLRNFANIFKIPELVRKLAFTLGVLILFRVGTFVPVIGVDVQALTEYMSKAIGSGGLFSYIDMFSGGAFSNCTLFALGIGPYITASIMMQMLQMTLPSLEQLSKEGEFGRRMINQYTRYVALGLSIVYSTMYSFVLEQNGLALTPGLGFKFLFVTSLTAGAMLVMWFGEQISLSGIGNGSSMIIFGGIVARFPNVVAKTVQQVQAGEMMGMSALIAVVILLALIGVIVMLEKGDRKIPVQYARRMVGQKMYAGQSSYIPFKINVVGVMPVIFASAMLNIPSFLFSFLSRYSEFFHNASLAFLPNTFLHEACKFGLVVFFTFFYTSLMFNPEELAQQLKKNGGFVPGIRPGRKTAGYFEYILNRLGLVGALYLGGLSVLPSILMLIYPVPFAFIGGTQLLILVGVLLEFSSQVESYLLEYSYDGFLSTGRIKS